MAVLFAISRNTGVGMTTVAFDLRNPGRVAHDLAQANRALATDPHASPTIVALVADLAQTLALAGDEELSAFDPVIARRIAQAGIRAQAAVDDDDPRRRRRDLRVVIEQMRALLEQAADEAAVSEDQPSKDIARWLVDTVDVSKTELAGVLGVPERSFQRWTSSTEQAAPDGQDALRIRVAARVVAQLRHAFTGPGVIAWLQHPRVELDGRPPAALLDDPEAIASLTALARSTRASSAA
jgi:hypothetical protein